MNPEFCPNCGAEVPSEASACPECGADEETGWNERATCERLGISDPDDFDHDEFVREEFGPVKERRLPLVWLMSALGVLGALFWWLFRR